MQLAHKVFLALCYESIRLHHIDALFKITVQEHCLNIHFSYLIIKMRHNGQDYFDGLKHGYQCKGLFIIEIRFLTITLCYQPSLICLTFPSTPLFFQQTHLHLMGFIPLGVFTRSQNSIITTHYFIVICGINLMFLLNSSKDSQIHEPIQLNNNPPTPHPLPLPLPHYNDALMHQN